MKKRSFAIGGSTTAGPASGVGPASGAGSPSMVGKKPTSADALRYFRATGNRAGADEILKAAVGKPAKMPEDYGSSFAKSGSLSPQQSAQAAMLERQKAGPQTPAGAVKPASSGIISSSKEALDSMPNMSFVPTIPGGASRMSDADRRSFEAVARPTPGPGPRAPVTASSAPINRGSPMVTRGGPASAMPTQMMRKGGQAKAYASGGTVRGAGIAQRGVKKCKVY